MSSQPILNPEIPYVGEVEGGIQPGKMVKIQGKAFEDSRRFAINYQLGPNLNPRDDIAIHVSPRFAEGFITRNHIQSMTWGPEENEGPLWIQPGTPFEIIILCEYNCYKIAVNGRHFTEFNHRLPYNKVTHLVIDGEVEIASIFYETIPIGPMPSAPVPDVPSIDVGPPPPGGLYPTLKPHETPREQYGDKDDFRNNPPRDYTYRDAYKEVHKDDDDDFGSCLDKVGLAVGGLVAAGGVAAAMHAYNKNKKKQLEGDETHEKTEASENESGLGGLGALGAALASSLASNAFQGDRNAHAQQGYPPQDATGGMLGSILGALGGGSSPGYHQQQPQADPLGGALGSILGGVLGGGGAGHQQPQYQPSGGYGGNQAHDGGNDLLSGLGGALFKSALDGLSRRSRHDEDNGGHYATSPPAPPPSSYGGRPYEDAPPSYSAPNPPAPGKGRLTAAEISKGLGLSDGED